MQASKAIPGCFILWAILRSSWLLIFLHQKTSSVWVSSATFHVSQRRDVTLPWPTSSLLLLPTHLLFTVLSESFIRLCLCWKYYPFKSVPSKGPLAPGVTHAIRMRWSSAQKHRKALFFKQWRTWAPALEYSLSWKVLGNRPKAGLLYRGLVSGEEAEFFLVGCSCVAHRCSSLKGRGLRLCTRPSTAIFCTRPTELTCQVQRLCTRHSAAAILNCRVGRSVPAQAPKLRCRYS